MKKEIKTCGFGCDNQFYGKNNTCPMHNQPPQPTPESWEKLRENLREEFEDLFPKDQEAIDGIRPSKSNRSAGLVLWAKWEVILRKALAQQEEKIRKEYEKD